MQRDQVIVAKNLSNDALNALSPTRRVEEAFRNNTRKNFQWPSTSGNNDGGASTKKNFQWSSSTTTTDKKNFQWSDNSRRGCNTLLTTSKDTTPKPPSTRLPRAVSTGGLRGFSGLTLNNRRGGGGRGVPQEREASTSLTTTRTPVNRTISSNEMTELRRHNSTNSLRMLAMANTGVRLKRRAPDAPSRPPPEGKKESCSFSSSKGADSSSSNMNLVGRIASIAAAGGATVTASNTIVALGERKVIRSPSSYSGSAMSPVTTPNNRRTTRDAAGGSHQEERPGSTAAVKAGIPGSIRIDHHHQTAQRRRSSRGGLAEAAAAEAASADEAGPPSSPQDDQLMQDPSSSSMMDAGESSSEEERKDDDVLPPVDVLPVEDGCSDQQQALNGSSMHLLCGEDSMSSIDEEVGSRFLEDMTDDEDDDDEDYSSSDDSSSIASEDYNDMVTGLWSQESSPLKIRNALLNNSKPPQEDVVVTTTKQEEEQDKKPSLSSAAAGDQMQGNGNDNRRTSMRWRKEDGTYITEATPEEFQNALNEGVNRAAQTVAAAASAAAVSQERQGNFKRSVSACTATSTTRSPPTQRRFLGARTDSGGSGHSDFTGTSSSMMQITVVYQPMPKPWTCVCGEENEHDYKFCGMCATAQYWKCSQCNFERNKCRNVCCGGCGAARSVVATTTTTTDTPTITIPPSA